MADTALTHGSDQVLSHYAVRRDSSKSKYFILSFSHGVNLIITTDQQDKVIQSSLNRARFMALSTYHRAVSLLFNHPGKIHQLSDVRVYHNYTWFQPCLAVIQRILVKLHCNIEY